MDKYTLQSLGEERYVALVKKLVAKIEAKRLEKRLIHAQSGEVRTLYKPDSQIDEWCAELLYRQSDLQDECEQNNA